jgi:hypothetical protein
VITGFSAVSTIYSSPIASGSKRTAASQADSTTPAGIRDFSLVAEDARAVLDAQYQDAQKNGKNIAFDSSKPGVPLDLSSLSDRAVAAIALNKNKLFTDLEVAQAGGYLSGQLQAALAPSFAASRLGDTLAPFKEVLTLYDQLEPEVRQALGLTDEHKLAIQQVIAKGQANSEETTSEEGFPGFIQLLRQMAEEWKQNHPDGYTPQGATYYTSESNSRSFMI